MARKVLCKPTCCPNQNPFICEKIPRQGCLWGAVSLGDTNRIYAVSLKTTLWLGSLRLKADQNTMYWNVPQNCKLEFRNASDLGRNNTFWKQVLSASSFSLPTAWRWFSPRASHFISPNNGYLCLMDMYSTRSKVQMTYGTYIYFDITRHHCQEEQQKSASLKTERIPGSPTVQSLQNYLFQRKEASAVKTEAEHNHVLTYSKPSCLFPTPGWNTRCKIYICQPQALLKQPCSTESSRCALVWPKEQPMNNMEAPRTSSFHILWENKITPKSTVGCCSAAPKQQHSQRSDLWGGKGTYKLNLWKTIRKKLQSICVLLPQAMPPPQ